MQTLYTKRSSFRWARLLSLLLLLLPLAGRAQVVISQIYAGGGSGTVGTTYTRDYVELFNRGTAAIDISGYAIQYASGTSTSGNYVANAVTATPGTPINLQPGQYYTVVLGTAGAAGATIAQGAAAGNADYVTATSTSSLSNAQAKLALTNNTTPLVITAATTPPASAAVQDFVGFGATATAYEGTGRAPAPTNTASALFRAGSGCTDTNDNAADFANAAPVVRNQSTTLAPCGGTNPVPTITTLSPSSATAGDPAQTLTVNGTNFISASVVNFNGTNRTTTFVSGTQLTIQLTTTDLATAGSFNVTVTNPAPGGGTTAASTFTVNMAPASNPVPTITSLSPSSVIAGAAAQTLTVNGTNFIGTSVVSFNGTNRTTTYVSATQLTIQLTATDQATVGSFNVTVTNPAPGGGTTAASTFTVNPVPAPTLTAISPTNPVGGATYVFTLTGTTFGTTANTTVSFNGTSVVPTSVNSGGTSLVVSLPLPAAGGTFPITVTTPSGTSGAQTLTVAAAPAGFFEPFEPGSQGSYPTTATAVTLRTGSYNFLEALLGSITPPGDKFNNTQGARIRGGGSITMSVDKAGGAGVVTISSAIYGSDTGSPSLTLEYSTDGGANFLAAPGSPAALTTTLTPYNFTLNVAGPVRLRIGTSNIVAQSNPRVNVDDLQISNFAAACNAPTGLTAGSITSSAASVSFTPSGTATNYTVTTSPVTTTQTVNGSPVSFTGLTPSTTYTVSIVSNCAGGLTSSPATVNFTTTAAALPDLTVNTGTLASPTPVAGNYNNITIAGMGVALVVGPLTAAGTFVVQAGGILAQNCQIMGGTGNFDLQAGGTLIICDAAGISLTGVPTGAVLLTGTRTYSPLAQYIYNGTVAQATGLGLPGTILALGVQNSTGVTLSQALSLTQGVNLSQGNLNTGGFTFTLLSSAAGTAGVVNTGGVVVGNTTVQRFINSSNPIGYRHYSAPVSNTTLADLTVPGVFTPTFNTAYNSNPTPGTTVAFPTVFGYDQSRIATVTSNFSAFDKGWFSPVATDPMVAAKGYTVNAPNTALIDFVGTLNNGPISTGTLSRGSDPSAGWQLVGNPYPSPIDWSTITLGQRPGMDAAVYVFESAGQYGGSYRTNVNGVGGNGNISPLIVSGSGCFVRVTTPNGTGSVNLDNSNRVTTFGPQPAFGRGTADLRPQLRLELLGNGLADRAHVYFQTGATNSVDSEFDAVKLPNPTGLNLASATATENLAINGLPALASSTVLVPLRVAVPQAGSYSLNAGDLANLAGTTVTLLDAQTNTRTVLAPGTTYAFTLTNTTAAGRFSVEFRPTGALATTPAQALAAQTQLFPNPASGSFRVQLPVLSSKSSVQATLLNVLGQTVLRRSLSAAAGQAIDAEFNVRALPAGVYTLRLDVNGLPVTRKVVVE